MTELLHNLPPRMLQAAVILNDAQMLDEKRLRLLKAADEGGRDVVAFALHLRKLNSALRSPS